MAPKQQDNLVLKLYDRAGEEGTDDESEQENAMAKLNLTNSPLACSENDMPKLSLTNDLPASINVRYWIGCDITCVDFFLYNTEAVHSSQLVALLLMFCFSYLRKPSFSFTFKSEDIRRIYTRTSDRATTINPRTISWRVMDRP
eukprot:scaffold381_cov178-Amphora_coffeaeformis.AAC.30